MRNTFAAPPMSNEAALRIARNLTLLDRVLSADERRAIGRLVEIIERHWPQETQPALRQLLEQTPPDAPEGTLGPPNWAETKETELGGES